MTFLDYASTNPEPEYRCVDYDYYVYFNSNANYALGERQKLQECGERIKTAIGAKNGKVVFGGTASQLFENLEVAMDCHIHWNIGSAYEHDSVDRFLNHNNLKTIDDLEHKLSTFKKWDRPIIFWQGVNNITGRVFPVEEIGKLCHKHNAFFVCDMTVMIDHTPLPANIDNWCDCAVWSGHNLGTELGVGCMWLSQGFDKWLENFQLHGTPNLAGAMAITDATEDAIDNAPDNELHYYELTKTLKSELTENGIEYDVIGDNQSIAAHAHAINAIRLHGINAYALQLWLANKKIYVGLGTNAWAENEAPDYRLLNAFGLNNKEASEIIRVSFGENSDANDIKTLASAIKEFKEKFINHAEETLKALQVNSFDEKIPDSMIRIIERYK